MQIWRSAGWPCRDPIEIDLLAAGLVTLHTSVEGHEVLRLTEAAFALLAQARQRNLSAQSRHAELAHGVARNLMASGRIVWLELSLRARVQVRGDENEAQAQSDVAPAAGPSLWRMARPDVYSIRHTTVENYLHPVVHEIKVSRADLLSDLRQAGKREAYAWLCSECYYVFPRGLAEPEEIPEPFGVCVAAGEGEALRIETLRPARHQARKLDFAVWMALAKAAPLQPGIDDAQLGLGAPTPD